MFKVAFCTRLMDKLWTILMGQLARAKARQLIGQHTARVLVYNHSRSMHSTHRHGTTMIAYQNERMGTWTTWWNRMHKHNGENKNRNSIAHSKANAKHSRVACERNERLYPGLLLCFAHKDVLIIRERDYGYWTGLGTDSEQTSKHCKLPMLHSTATGSACVCALPLQCECKQHWALSKVALWGIHSNPSKQEYELNW